MRVLGPHRRSPEVLRWPGTKEYFQEGPGRLWKALWGAKETIWDIYPGVDDFEGLWGEYALIDDVLTNLEMKLFSSVDSRTPLSYEDLGRAIVLYRTLYDGNSCRDCIRAYICVRLALADMAPSLKGLGIYDFLSTHMAYLEFEQVRLSYRILGHQDLKTTMRYAHLAPDHLNSARVLNPLTTRSCAE
jgi:hypothetical protein